MKRLVLAGGGHAHVEVLRDFALAPAQAQITLVTRAPWLTYSGMVPGVIAGHYVLDDCSIDLARLAARAGARAVYSEVTRIDTVRREMACANGTVIGYDVLSLDVGAAAPLDRVRGAREHAVPMRPLDAMVKRFGAALDRARRGEVRAITLVGGGAAGVELALAMAHRGLGELGPAAPHVRVITDAPSIVPEFPPAARARLLRELRRRGVGVHPSSPVTGITAETVTTGHGHTFASDAVFWSAGVAAHSWIAESGFATDPRGFLLVDATLQSTSHPLVFGAGDCATRADGEMPKAGVFAVRAAPVLAKNLRAALGAGALEPHRTRRRFLALVATGPKRAVAVWNGFSWTGASLWRLKDRIDRAFVARYNEITSAPTRT